MAAITSRRRSGSSTAHRPGQLPDQVRLYLAGVVVRHPMQITHRGTQVPVAEIVLQIVQGQTGGQLVGGVGVAQGMDAADLVDASRGPGVLEDLLCGADAHRPCGVGSRRKQAGARAVQAPIGAQVFEQARPDRNETVFGALALFDPQQATFAVDVRDPQVHQFAYAQSAAIAGRQQGAMLGVGAGRQQRGHLGAAEQFGQPLRALGQGDGEVKVLPFKDFAVQEAGRVVVLSAGGRGQPTLDDQMAEVVAHLPGGQVIRRPVEVAGQIADRTKIGLVGAHGITTLAHGLDHSLAKSAHRCTPLSRMNRRRSIKESER